MGGRIGGGLDRSGLGRAGRRERYRMGVCLGEDGHHSEAKRLVFGLMFGVDWPIWGHVRNALPDYLSRAPHAFTLCGGEGGGDHLSAFAYAIHGHEALEHFAIDKIDGSGDVLLGDGHCAGSQ